MCNVPPAWLSMGDLTKSYGLILNSSSIMGKAVGINLLIAVFRLKLATLHMDPQVSDSQIRITV